MLIILYRYFVDCKQTHGLSVPRTWSSLSQLADQQAKTVLGSWLLQRKYEYIITFPSRLGPGFTHPHSCSLSFPRPFASKEKRPYSILRTLRYTFQLRQSVLVLLLCAKPQHTQHNCYNRASTFHWIGRINCRLRSRALLRSCSVRLVLRTLYSVRICTHTRSLSRSSPAACHLILLAQPTQISEGETNSNDEAFTRPIFHPSPTLPLVLYEYLCSAPPAPAAPQRETGQALEHPLHVSQTSAQSHWSAFSIISNILRDPPSLSRPKTTSCNPLNLEPVATQLCIITQHVARGGKEGEEKPHSLTTDAVCSCIPISFFNRR